MERSIKRRLTRRDILKLGGTTLVGVIAVSCTPTNTTVQTPATSGATFSPTTATGGQTGSTPATTTNPGAPTAAALPAELMPGSPNHPKGWKTNLPAVPAGLPANPPISITSSRRVDSSMKFAQGDSIENSQFTRLTKHLFGIEWKPAFTWATTDDGEQKYNLAMASGQLPDFLETVPTTLFVKMLEANLLEDITDVWEATASPEFVKKPMEFGGSGLAWAYAEVKGRKMGIPYIERTAQNDKLLWIRKDWLDKVSMDVPKTLDDMAKVGQAFVKAGLAQGATGSTVGLNCSKDLNGWYSSLDPVFGAFGIIPGFWTKEGDGLMYDNTRPQMKEALALLRQWYADGIIPSDFFTRQSSESEKLVSGNRAGMHFSPDFAAGFGIPDSIKNDPNAKWIFADIPTGPGGRKGKAWSNPYPGTVFAFRKGFKHVDAVIKQTNWLAELTQVPDNRFHGWEGRDYEWNGDTIKPTGIGSTKQFYGPIGTNGNSGTDPLRTYKSQQKVEEWAKLPREQRDAYQLYATEDPTGLATLGRQAYLFNVENTEKVGIKNLFTTLPTSTMVSMGSNIRKLEEESLISIINGERPLSAYEEYVSQWKQLGGEKITQEVNEWWKSKQR